MIEFRSEVLPDRGIVSGSPPRCQRETQHVQHSENRRNADEHSENQTDPDEQFDNADQIPEKNDMRKYDVTENRPIEADGRLLNVAVEIMCESAVGECTSENFVFSK